MDILVNFFKISVYTMNLFSLIIGMIIGLSTGAFTRYRVWWVVVGYFCAVAFYYALIGGAFNGFLMK